ncbi:metallohydrolase [Methylorubrum populi]|jgi:beta-lactamase superfamily II metal-dependent hydrolase|uniref:metallohydrolase n=1 Tax=Methylobacteriaceae TaxID=119045 RepID=UPI0025FB786E|nr:metallohydrolase [Methylobacterium sp.]MBX9934653.1 metallohydrolase [Methylobacterium sp.]
MSAKTTHFKVGNGDMTLMVLESGRRLLIDCKIGVAADDPNDDAPDVGTQLRDRLTRDASGRLFVDAFLLTHPDQDHCAGLRRHFHLGPPASWVKADDKIVIREMWSSPIVFRRADRKNAKSGHTLCEDAQAWRDEARRRVRLFRAQRWLTDGDRIQILGEDVDGKTDDLLPILVSAGSAFSTICGVTDATFSGLLLAPMLADDDAEAEVLSKNNSSVIVRLTLAAGGNPMAGRFLFGGDAEVAIWERVRDRYTDQDLTYDVLMAPHHCSWHSLSWDSWSEKREKAVVSERARSALAQAASGAIIISSSNAILDDNCDPPCIRAKREYEAILKPVLGPFRCVADEPGDDPLEISVSYFGVKPFRLLAGVAGGLATGVGSEALAHG